ncbi:MAG: NUDIX hydrolase [Patescibacteria group bacterium]|nr:NUDIX hydrolase [Patescibacteria group bacterium]
MNLENAKFIIASGPVIIENDKVLLNRHGDTKADKRIWKFVGGKVKKSDFNQIDTLENTCKREAKEEMGINIEIISAIKPMIIKHPHKQNTVVVLIHYLAKRLGKIKLGKDIIEYKWFTINNLPKNCAPNIKPVIDEYKLLVKKPILN